MFSYFLGYLNTEEVYALLDKKLREVNDNPDSRFCTLKKRLLEHFELLQNEKEFGLETVQHLIDILGTDSNYEEKLKRVVAGNSKKPDSGLFSGFLGYFSPLTSLFHKPSKTKPNGYRLVQEDDTTFLTEICTIVTEKPAYRPIVEEILQEATKSLGTKLRRLEKELLHLVRGQIRRIVMQAIDDQVNTERQDADLVANTRLRSLIREALDAETDHPTSR